MHKGNTCAACMYLLLLFLFPVSPQCRTGTAAECKKSETFVPGYHLAGHGIDITVLDDTVHSVFDLNEWQKSDGGCTLCENPLMKGKPLQRLPLAVTEWKANISCQKGPPHPVQESPVSVAKALTGLLVQNDWTNELDVQTHPSIDIRRALAGSQSRLVYVSMRYSKDKFRISKDQLSEEFKNGIKTLPEKYDRSSKLKYRKLIENYGTHFMTELEVGGTFRSLTAIPICKIMLDGFSVSEISRCQAIELDSIINYDEVVNSSNYQKCKEKKENPSFFRLFQASSRKIRGGADFIGVLLFGGQDQEASQKWLEGITSLPAPLFYWVEPLHTLVAKDNPRREGLRQAVSEYVRERALWRNCTQPCPLGSYPRAGDSCICECPNNSFTDLMCCSLWRGLAKLTVTIQHARHLWGDFFSRTDAYVKVFFQKKQMQTRTVWNKNNPTWNVNLDFGVIQILEDFSKIQVEVWDQDYGWDDDLLGMCKLMLEPWTPKLQICYLNHGHLHFKYRLACGPNLGGSSCRDYIPWGLSHVNL